MKKLLNIQGHLEEKEFILVNLLFFFHCVIYITIVHATRKQKMTYLNKKLLVFKTILIMN
jgi:hypothetical protein